MVLCFCVMSLIPLICCCFKSTAWLHQNHLSIINEISSNFCSTSVSGMDQCSLLVGRPFGGCSIIYRKSLLSSVSPIALVLIVSVLWSLGTLVLSHAWLCVCICLRLSIHHHIWSI